MIIRAFFQKLTNFDVFRNKAIRHIKIAFRHMLRVANGLYNAAVEGSTLNTLEVQFFHKFAKTNQLKSLQLHIKVLKLYACFEKMKVKCCFSYVETINCESFMVRSPIFVPARLGSQ